MSLNLVSPGVKVREVDLTVGRIDAINDQVGVIAGPFLRGPVGVPVLVDTEKTLLETFGKPLSNDGQYEYWMSASSYLSYGGVVRVVRSDSDNLVNSHSPVSSALGLKIKSTEDYDNSQTNPTGWTWATKNPGSWGNGLKVCVIDSAADQILGIGTFGLTVGMALTCGLNGVQYVTSSGTIDTFTGYLKGIITKIGDQSIDVKITNNFDYITNLSSEVEYSSNPLTSFPQPTANSKIFFQAFNNVGTATSLEKFRLPNSATVGVGSTVIDVSDFPEVGPQPAIGDLIQTLN